jgi:ketosteroid isomerase-like protein
MSDNTNAITLTSFFEGFRMGDVAAMQLCLHPDVEFRDIGFDLRGREVPAMWDMIVSKKIEVSYRDLKVEGDTGTAHWECNYEFRKDAESDPRPVHNVIDSTFRFEGGLIRTQQDECDFWTWFEQAMGPLGKAAHAFGVIEGGLEHLLKRDIPLNVEEKLRAKVKETARGKIAAFILKHPEYAS